MLPRADDILSRMRRDSILGETIFFPGRDDIQGVSRSQERRYFPGEDDITVRGVIKVTATNILALEKEVAVGDAFPGETLYVGDNRRFTPQSWCTALRSRLSTHVLGKCAIHGGKLGQGDEEYSPLGENGLSSSYCVDP